jgi:hypothetical protein
MQMGLGIVTNDTFSSHFHLTCKWWEFIIQMIHYQSICTKNQSGDNSTSHDTVEMGQQLLTRSVVVINLSRYLQTLTLTGYQKLKHYKHLITNIIVTRYLASASSAQPHATLPARLTPVGQANTAPYPAAHRDSSILTTGTINRWITPGNVYYHNCRAVSTHNRCGWLVLN